MDFKAVQDKWQKRWSHEADPDKRKGVLTTFPYPYLNGALHIGHAFTAARVDAFARYHRLKGENVLFPFAFHATGEPIVGLAKRLKSGEKAAHDQLKKSGLDEKTIKSFKDPQKIVDYYKAECVRLAKLMGLSVDWRRQFVTIEPFYAKFIEWQYKTLHKKGLVGKGSHPVVYCPSCESPTGDHDRLVGEGETIEEFTLLKFKVGEEFLVAATLRPETVFGQTNMWVNPNVEYLRVKVGKETWVMSQECYDKLKFQKENIKVAGKVKGTEYIGKYCHAPGLEKDIMILPGPFCDAKVGSGIVTSVPSHAVWDYQALKDLQDSKKECKKYELDYEKVKAIPLLSIIKTPGYGEHPAKDFCVEHKVKSQKDSDKLEQGKKEIYKIEFHKGMMRKNCGKYSRLPVIKAKDAVKEDLIKAGKADVMQEISGPVQCRCGTWCIIKVLKDQWFLKYSDPKWKSLGRKALKKCRLYPEDYRTAFEYTVDWLKDKACARKSGMGTHLPWDKGWIIETLSDSTIYNTFYTFAHKLRDVPVEKLTPEFFDYIFYEKGKADKLMKEMRKEFLYWYPVNFRNSGKDLVNNHLTFFLFHHAALFDEELWPVGIGVNGFVTSKGEKMSKSKGNVVALAQVLDEFGADIMRLNMLYSAEGTQDPNWDPDAAKNMICWAKRLEDYVAGIGKGEKKDLKGIDFWMLWRVNEKLDEVTAAYEDMRLRSAIKAGLFDVLADYKHYLMRTKNEGRPAKSYVMKYVMQHVLAFIEPVMPFMAWELSERLGVGLKWPKKEEFKGDFASREEYLQGIVEDVRAIAKIIGKAPSKVGLYVCTEDKRKLVKSVVKAKDFGSAMKAVKGKLPQGVVKLVFSKKQEFSKPEIDELGILNEERAFLESVLGAEVLVFPEDKAGWDPANKAGKAMPWKPAIYAE